MFGEPLRKFNAIVEDYGDGGGKCHAGTFVTFSQLSARL